MRSRSSGGLTGDGERAPKLARPAGAGGGRLPVGRTSLHDSQLASGRGSPSREKVHPGSQLRGSGAPSGGDSPSGSDALTAPHTRAGESSSTSQRESVRGFVGVTLRPPRRLAPILSFCRTKHREQIHALSAVSRAGRTDRNRQKQAPKQLSCWISAFADGFLHFLCCPCSSVCSVGGSPLLWGSHSCMC